MHETPGPGSSARILQYHAETTLKATDDSVPWCAAFVCAILEWTGIPSPRSARAKDFLNWGRPIEKPIEGCIVVMERPPHGGHVGFFVWENASHVNILGGNQKDSVRELRFPKMFVIGYRMPPEKYWSPDDSSQDNSSLT